MDKGKIFPHLLKFSDPFSDQLSRNSLKVLIMKIQWSVFYALFLFILAGCGAEQFGTVPQSSTSNPDAVKGFQQVSCTSSTLVKPKVDILYVVDNSGSALAMSNDIKTSITNTIGSISQQFDYRVIGTKLIPDTASDFDYRVMTNSTDALPNSSKKIISSSEMPFFTPPVVGAPREAGLKRVVQFINSNGSLIRNNSHLLIILVSNGRDTEIEVDHDGIATTPTQQNSSLFNTRISELNSIRMSKSLIELRFMPITTHADNCTSGARSSLNSYVAMGNALTNSEIFNLCSNTVSNIFAQVNSSIQQETIPHQYRFFPMTFAKSTDTRNSFGEIKVYKVSGNSAPVEMTSGWSYHESTQGYENTRELPSVGEPVNGRHFIRFNSLVSYPDCIQIKSVSRTEYFGFVVLPKEPKPETVTVRINGNVVSQSSSNGWTYIGNTTRNIKMAYPNAGDDQPAVMKTGYMLQLNGSSNYYKSGDNVEVNYIPAGI